MQIVLTSETDWEGWRLAARALILSGAEPETLTWSVGAARTALPEASGTFGVPRSLVSLATLAIQSREADRFGLLYTLFWRVHAGDRFLDDDGDPDLALARRMAHAVRAEAHRMRTHIRWLPVPEDHGTRYLGWFDPMHHVLEANAQLLIRQFPRHVLSIVTPDRAAHTLDGRLVFGSGLHHAADDEALQAWWERHRDGLLEQAAEDVSIPAAEPGDETPRPPELAPLGPVVLHRRADAALLRAARDASVCHRCPLCEPATQTVFGEGPPDAPVMFVGEQPGDQEDIIGRPFVGPAGQLMDRAMEEAGIDRRMIYITNAVKHFKFTSRGRRRIHQTPEVPEIQACGFWLDVERSVLKPRLIVLMGASAARAVLGRPVGVGRERGRPIRMDNGQTVFITVHPSFLLRLPDAAAKAREYANFVRDLRAVRALLEAG